MKLKFQCPCGKRLLALATESGTKRDCPRCHEILTIPEFSAGNILALLCSCGEELNDITCSACNKTYPELEVHYAKTQVKSTTSKRTLTKESSEESSEKSSEEPSEKATDNSIENIQEEKEEKELAKKIKKVQSLNEEAFTVKFQCECGKRIVAPVSKIGKENVCKLCNKPLIIPNQEENEFIGFICKCSALLPKEAKKCPECETPLYFEKEIEVEEKIESKLTPNLLIKLAGVSLITSFCFLFFLLHILGIYQFSFLSSKKDRFDDEYQKQLASDKKFQEELKKASKIPKVDPSLETKEPTPSKETMPDPLAEDPMAMEEETINEQMKEDFVPVDEETEPAETNEEEEEDSAEKLPPTIMKAATEKKELPPFRTVELKAVDGLDYEYFKERIQPIIAANCSSTDCHGGPGKLEPPADENRIHYNYNRVVKFVVPTDPALSLFLQKPLAVSVGGMQHPPDIFDRKSFIYKTFVEWIEGGTLETASVIEVEENATAEEKQRFAQSKSCLQCHKGIEEMHPWAPLGCVDCHGGDANASSKKKAHVQPKRKIPNDERVLPLTFDPDYLRFLNPTNLRVVEKSCNKCHAKYISNFKKSLHGTTAGHLSDGFYETGKLSKKSSPFSIFPIIDDDGFIPEEGIKRLTQVPSFSSSSPRGKFETHYSDLPRKSCMRCHFWSVGQAVRGRLGQDGDYRAEGCAGCHVKYELDGLSRSKDPTIKKFEPGHPSIHQMTSRVPTSTCTSCHYGDASIGLNFRGLSQLIPGMPGGPEVKGTTNQQLNGVFYLKDPKLNPADIHHQRGMNCIDCHTIRDVMGDGNIYGAMEHAVEIECVDCHGTFDTVSTLTTSRGRALKHLSKAENGDIYLLGKIDGKKRRIKQAKNVVTPGNRDFNPKARQAMTKSHERLECYSCHSGWSINFFGFHFDRNESFTQLDMLSGRRTPGRVTTQEKVFASFKQFYLGFSSEGKIAPYMVGFSTMGTVWDKNGRKIMDHRMPETSSGLSGMTMIHHQLHNVQRFTRTCIECHRTSATYGMGSKNYKLARHFFYALTQKGVEAVAFNKKDLGKSAPVAAIPLENAESLAILSDKVQGEAQFGYAAVNEKELAVLYLRNPVFPVVLQKIKLPGIKYLYLSGEYLYACCQDNGLYIFTIKDPKRPKVVKKLETTNARHCDLHWPHLYVADGAGGLRVIDVRIPKEAKEVYKLNLMSSVRGQSVVQGQTDSAYLVRSFFQYGKLSNDGKKRQSPIHLLFVADEGGIHMVNATNPERPYVFRQLVPRRLFQRFDLFSIGGIEVGTHIDLGSDGGKIPTEENDYVYVGLNTNNNQMDRVSLFVIKISNPLRPQIVGRIQAINSSQLRDVKLAKVYNAPFLTPYILLAHRAGITAVSVLKSTKPETITTILDRTQSFAVQLEEMPLDQMISTDGDPLKDISHEKARYLNQEEISKLLQVPLGK